MVVVDAARLDCINLPVLAVLYSYEAERSAMPRTRIAYNRDTGERRLVWNLHKRQLGAARFWKSDIPMVQPYPQ